MKRGVIALIVIGLIIIGAIAFYIFSQKTASDSQEIQTQQTETGSESASQSAQEETPAAAEESSPELFQPLLTYPEAYNGPLYATSEQIGNYPDKDKYMSNLKRNGVNFFIGMFAIFGKPSQPLASNADLGYVADLAKKYP